MTLIEMRQPKKATEIIIDNYAADGIMKGTIKQKRTKSMDMRFYSVHDQLEQKHFEVNGNQDTWTLVINSLNIIYLHTIWAWYKHTWYTISLQYRSVSCEGEL